MHFCIIWQHYPALSVAFTVRYGCSIICHLPWEQLHKCPCYWCFLPSSNRFFSLVSSANQSLDLILCYTYESLAFRWLHSITSNVWGIGIMFLILISLFYSYLPSCLLNYVAINNSCHCCCSLSYYNFSFLKNFYPVASGIFAPESAAFPLLKSAD